MTYDQCMLAKLLPAPRSTPGDLAAKVLEAAGKLLEDQGLHALTLRRTAELAGVAPMSIYHHFGSKDGLLDALLFEAFSTLEHELRMVGSHPDPLLAYAQSGERYRSLAFARPATYRLMFTGSGIGLHASEEASSAALKSFAALVATCQRLLDAKIVTERSAIEVAQITWASIHGSVTLELAGLDFTGGAYPALAEVLLAGLKTHPRPALP
jgi:AcrR family transcriptional regulator